MQSVLVLELMNHTCQLAAFSSSVSVFGYGAHRMILRAHPDQEVIEPMPNFYESAAVESGYKKQQPKLGLKVSSKLQCWTSVLGQKRTSELTPSMSAFGGKADITFARSGSALPLMGPGIAALPQVPVSMLRKKPITTT
jgi:hypothetical protein